MDTATRARALRALAARLPPGTCPARAPTRGIISNRFAVSTTGHSDPRAVASRPRGQAAARHLPPKSNNPKKPEARAPARRAARRREKRLRACRAAARTCSESAWLPEPGLPASQPDRLTKERAALREDVGRIRRAARQSYRPTGASSAHPPHSFHSGPSVKGFAKSLSALQNPRCRSPSLSRVRALTGDTRPLKPQ